MSLVFALYDYDDHGNDIHSRIALFNISLYSNMTDGSGFPYSGVPPRIVD